MADEVYLSVRMFDQLMQRRIYGVRIDQGKTIPSDLKDVGDVRKQI